MYQVLYCSRGGHTRKIADVIAKETGAKAADITGATLDPAAKIIFLGTGCYGGAPGEDMQKFIDSHDFKGRKIALFSTSAGGAGKELDTMSGDLKQKGAAIVGRFTCKGQFIQFVSRGHPNQADLDGAAKFARDMIKSA